MRDLNLQRLGHEGDRFLYARARRASPVGALHWRQPLFSRNLPPVCSPVDFVLPEIALSTRIPLLLSPAPLHRPLRRSHCGAAGRSFQPERPELLPFLPQGRLPSPVRHWPRQTRPPRLAWSLIDLRLGRRSPRPRLASWIPPRGSRQRARAILRPRFHQERRCPASEPRRIGDLASPCHRRQERLNLR